jgi:hypothetical protein
MEMKITSDFAVLDVKQGRKKLSDHFKARPRLGECPADLRIPVTITGYIDGEHSHDDGVSIEFTVIVENVTTA